MYDIVGCEDEPHRLVDRYVNIVVKFYIVLAAQFSIRTRVAHFPVELFGSHAYFEIRVRNLPLYFCPGGCAHERQHDQNDSGDDRPDDFERGIAVTVGRAPPRLLPVLDQKNDHQDSNQNERCGGYVVDEIK